MKDLSLEIARAVGREVLQKDGSDSPCANCGGDGAVGHTHTQREIDSAEEKRKGEVRRKECCMLQSNVDTTGS